MTDKGRQGVGWAVLGLVVCLAMGLVALAVPGDGQQAEAVLNLAILGGLVMVVGGLAVLAVSLIRGRT